MMDKLKHLTKGQKIQGTALIVALLALFILPPVIGLKTSHWSILITVLLYMFYASSWNFMGGYTGLFSLGNGIYIGLGAYITACLYLYAGITPWIGIIIAAFLTGFLSMVLGYPTFKLQNIYYSFATFALLQIMLVIFKNFKTFFGLFKLGGAEGLKVSSTTNSPGTMQFLSKVPYYYIILILLIVVLLVSYYISHSKRGFYFRAISANMEAASSLGVNVMNMKLQAQFLTAFFSAIGGGFYCMFLGYVDPSKMFGTDLSVFVMVYCVVGGANTLWGPVLGAGLMYTINRVVTIYAADFPGLANIIFGAILMLVIYFMPGGLIPWFQELREKRAAQKRAAELKAQNEGGAQQ